MEFFSNSGIDLKIFSPTEPIGIIILFIGLIFSGMIFYIIYAVSTNKESLEDAKIRNVRAVSYTHLTLPTSDQSRSRWSPYH